MRRVKARGARLPSMEEKLPFASLRTQPSGPTSPATRAAIFGRSLPGSLPAAELRIPSAARTQFDLKFRRRLKAEPANRDRRSRFFPAGAVRRHFSGGGAFASRKLSFQNAGWR